MRNLLFVTEYFRNNAKDKTVQADTSQLVQIE